MRCVALAALLACGCYDFDELVPPRPGGASPVRYIDSTTGGPAYAKQVTLTAPTTAAADDLLVAAVYIEGMSAPLEAPDAEWERVGDDLAAWPHSVRVWTYRQRSGGPSSYSFRHSSTTD